MYEPSWWASQRAATLIPAESRPLATGCSSSITLLVLEIRVPEVEEGHMLAEALLKLWPLYLAYALSVLIIGTM